MIKVARVSFSGNEEALYDFFTELDLEPGSLVICDLTPAKPKIGTVLSIANESEKANKWIIGKVDYKAFKARLSELEDRRAKQEIDDLLG